MKFSYVVFYLSFSAFLLNIIKSDSVCDLNTLIYELRQDLADNGMLDCLRVIPPPHFVEESEKQKNLRLGAQWDSSCSFESNDTWFDQAKKVWDIQVLVDSSGEPVKHDFPDQADMCELVRAAISKNIFQLDSLNMQQIPEEILDKIDCTGITESPRAGPRICAVNGTSFYQVDSWTIIIGSHNIKVYYILLILVWW